VTAGVTMVPAGGINGLNRRRNVGRLVFLTQDPGGIQEETTVLA